MTCARFAPRSATARQHMTPDIGDSAGDAARQPAISISRSHVRATWATGSGVGGHRQRANVRRRGAWAGDADGLGSAERLFRAKYLFALSRIGQSEGLPATLWPKRHR